MSTQKTTFKILKTIAKNSQQVAKEKASIKLNIPIKLLEVTLVDKCFVVTKR